MKLARRMDSFEESATMEIGGKITRLNAQGRDIISFAAGEPDFDTPDFIKQAAVNAINKGFNKYTPVAGNDAIKTAIIEFTQKTLGVTYAKNEVIVSLGAKHSLYNISQALFDEWDEVIIFSPYWVSYPNQVLLAGAKPVFVNCDAKNGFMPDIDDLKKKITPATKAIILNSPCNPTGAVYSNEIIRKIAEIAVEDDIILISDEIYDAIVYDGARPLSPVQLGDDVKKQTILVNGFSKTFSMTGWRLGYSLASADVTTAMVKIQSQSTSNPVTPMQYAAVEALKDLSFLAPRLEEFRKRRDVIVKALNSLDGVKCTTPTGAFYVFPDFSGWIGKKIDGEEIKDSASLANLLIEKAEIGPVPGAAFGAENHLRFSYALSEKQITEGMRRLSAFAAKLTD
ncbi:MAG: pyridoxal phosphate-dependent aminotransferase [Nitrospinae bacterium]|nr:pyridoxal phosphate-dependent aminotransferase [Nitrospinota bacterium]